MVCMALPGVCFKKVYLDSEMSGFYYMYDYFLFSGLSPEQAKKYFYPNYPIMFKAILS